MTLPEAERPLLASFGRRRGRKLRPGKQGLMDTYLPTISLSLPEHGRIDLTSLFSSPLRGEDQGGGEMLAPSLPIEHPLPTLPPQGGGHISEVWLEIGFGGGEHLAHQSSLNPSIGIIGCEPYINGIAGLLTQLQAQTTQNVRIWQHDARLVTSRLPDASIGRVFILYPDPWPKARHNKRRLVSSEFLDELARIMKPGAELRLATDHEDYCAWMLERLLPHPKFEWLAKECNDWLNPPKDWITTRYEQKRLAGQPTYLNFVRT